MRRHHHNVESDGMQQKEGGGISHRVVAYNNKLVLQTPLLLETKAFSSLKSSSFVLGFFSVCYMTAEPRVSHKA